MAIAEVYIFRKEHDNSIETIERTFYLDDGAAYGQHSEPDEDGFALVAYAAAGDEDDASDQARRSLCVECRLPRKPWRPPAGHLGLMCSCVHCDGCCEMVPAVEAEDGMCARCRE